MSLTELQIENIADHLKSAGFDISELDNDRIATIAACIIEALDIDFAN